MTNQEVYTEESVHSSGTGGLSAYILDVQGGVADSMN